MGEEIETVLERVDGEIVNDVAVTQQKMEIRLISPTEDGFLKVIKWNKEELESAVRQKIAEYENVVYTEDNMKQAKADRAGLNGLANDVDDCRKKVKKIINKPYEIFESEIKEILELIQEPISVIDRQVKAFEDQQKEEKKNDIRHAYAEVIGDLAEILPFERVFDTRYLNKTYKLGAAQAEVREKVQKVRTDLETIDGLDSKYKLNAKDVYIKTLDLSKALAENKRLSELEAKLEADKKRKAEEEAERRRREEERRRVAEERARAEEKAREAEEARAVETNAPAVKGEMETAGIPVNNEKESHNVQNDVKRTDDHVVAPPAGDAVVSDPFAPQESPKQYKASFTVYGTKDQIMAVKQFMVDNNIQFGKVEK